MTSPPTIPLSVLDLCPVPEGTTAADALHHSIDLARRVERLGYHRHWVAEHHNFPGIASSSPPVLMAHLAATTSTMRIGAGGLMLPNHSALAVAEQFGMLEAIHPGRIDLGLGRAPGTDPATAAALRRVSVQVRDEFPEQLRDLLAYFEGSHPRIRAVPAQGYRPQLWMLGSSDYSAQVAGMLGVPFSFAHHFATSDTGSALSAYLGTFRPSPWLEQPYSKIGVSVICAPTTEEAEYLAGPNAFAFVRLRQGRPTQLPTPQAVVDYEFTEGEKELLRLWRRPVVIGDPASVRDQLSALVDRYRVDELMITTMVYDHDDRTRSYELLAAAWGLDDLTLADADQSLPH